MSLASLTTNLPNGVTNVASNSAMGTLTQLDPAKLHTYYNDFNFYNAADWVVTVVEVGSGSATQAIIDEGKGILAITNDNALDDRSFLQLANETFKFVSGKKLHFKARFKVLDVTDLFVIGLQIRDTTPFNVLDGVYFFSNGPAQALEFIVKKNDVASTAIVANLSNDTYFEVAFIYDGESEIQYWLDGVKIGVLNTDNLPDDEELTVSLAIQNDAAVISSLSIDYIYVANER